MPVLMTICLLVGLGGAGTPLPNRSRSGFMLVQMWLKLAVPWRSLMDKSLKEEMTLQRRRQRSGRTASSLQTTAVIRVFPVTICD
jgi:hypothetical protein